MSVTRDDLAALRRTTLRARRDSVALSFVPGADRLDLVFSIRTSVGSAVARNRARRRVRELLRTRAEPLAAGVYLVSLRSDLAELDHAELGALLERLLVQLEQRTRRATAR